MKTKQYGSSQLSIVLALFQRFQQPLHGACSYAQYAIQGLCPSRLLLEEQSVNEQVVLCPRAYFEAVLRN